MADSQSVTRWAWSAAPSIAARPGAADGVDQPVVVEPAARVEADQSSGSVDVFRGGDDAADACAEQRLEVAGGRGGAGRLLM
ncbi:hypothetical protein EF294_08485 [Gordonia oryzae]|uniref:Uncharacterized protein n=1 Tax=Gordonia oryzae TaxID=2487349 RepID=A0A3N4GY26_9ACTN|nr:hypothetical protein EF294_08485 [Gordonia oryzae]